MMEFRRRACLANVCIFVVLLAAGLPANAVDLWSSEDGSDSLYLDISPKASTLVSHAPNDPVVYPERWNSAGLFRVRLGLGAKIDELMNGELAYEQRARLVSDGYASGPGFGVLPSEAKAPYRINQLDWNIDRHGDTFSYRHEFDRAFVSMHPEWGEITLGRQAIGLGRGVVFSAVDVFSPFSPLEVDREWRRGVDAVRVERKINDRSSLEVIGAFGEDWDESALLGRIRGYMGNSDAELILGKRCEDFMYAGTISSAVRNTEVHVELAVFDTPEVQVDGGLFGNDKLVGKAVAGASHTYDIGRGLTVLAEYHYSGFGVKHIEEAVLRLQDSVFQERYFRGDMQIISRHALAVRLSYPLTDTVSSSLLVMNSPEDWSGIVVPSVTWDFARDMSLIANIFLPWGRGSDGGKFESEYGASPVSGFVQMALYY